MLDIYCKGNQKLYFVVLDQSLPFHCGSHRPIFESYLPILEANSMSLNFSQIEG